MRPFDIEAMANVLSLSLSHSISRKSFSPRKIYARLAEKELLNSLRSANDDKRWANYHQSQNLGQKTFVLSNSWKAFQSDAVERERRKWLFSVVVVVVVILSFYSMIGVHISKRFDVVISWTVKYNYLVVLADWLINRYVNESDGWSSPCLHNQVFVIDLIPKETVLMMDTLKWTFVCWSQWRNRRTFIF